MKDLPFTVLIVALILAFLVWSDIQERHRQEAARQSYIESGGPEFEKRFLNEYLRRSTQVNTREP